MRKKINSDIKSTPEIENLLTNFHPKFGNERHLQIVKEYNEIVSLKSQIENNVLRARELTRLISMTQVRSGKLKEKEEHLLWLLTQELSPENGVIPKVIP